MCSVVLHILLRKGGRVQVALGRSLWLRHPGVVRPGKELKAISLGGRTPRKCRSLEVHASSGEVEALPVASRKTLFATRRAVRKPVMGAVGARFRMASR
ncbi:hypothetical protein KC349_g184 [Hortaea werneckii]|nr:hypothetical protein KC349_g184 [Hortaea werneckii]